jgi:hypothetical protein
MSIQILRERLAHAKKLKLKTSGATTAEVEAALAEYDRLRAALERVEKYLASEESPLYTLWENGDICSWDDNPREFWKDVLDDLRNFKMSVLDIGHGVEWEAVTVYRAVLAALEPGRQEGGE